MPSLPIISDASSSPGLATADEREIMDATMNSVEAKEESRQREDSMVVLVGAWRKCRRKREEGLFVRGA